MDGWGKAKLSKAKAYVRNLINTTAHLNSTQESILHGGSTASGVPSKRKSSRSYNRGSGTFRGISCENMPDKVIGRDITMGCMSKLQPGPDRRGFRSHKTTFQCNIPGLSRLVNNLSVFYSHFGGVVGIGVARSTYCRSLAPDK